jgi:hypothetical protein
MLKIARPMSSNALQLVAAASLRFIWRFLYSSNSGLTSNMCQHVKICWGEDAVTAADMTGNIQTACKAVTIRTVFHFI